MDISTDSIFVYVAFISFFLFSVIFSLLINGLLLRFARTLGLRQEQHPELIRWSNQVKPSVGGFSFYILFLIALSFFGIFNPEIDQVMSRKVLGMVFTVSLGFLLGLADDAYNTYPLLKLAGQLLCGSFLVFTGTIIQATSFFSINAVLTILWVAGIMNSINMLDNMDGICATVALCIVASCLMVLGIENHFYSYYSLILIGVAGGLIGFLFFNWSPAKIYMGDTGSQFLGSFIASVSIPLLWQYHDVTGSQFQFKQFLFPLLVFIVPIIDTTTVFFRRILRRQSPFVGGKDHITHHFVYAGFSETQVNYLLGGVSILSSLFAIFMIAMGNEAGSLYVLAFYIFFILMFILIQFIYERGKINRQATK